MKKTILIVDDALFMRMMLKKTILQDTAYDYEIIEAQNGEEAITLFETKRPDLVLLDITMPGMNGLEALKEMKQKITTIPIIMCSAMAQESMVVDAIKAGAEGFIVKPFTADKIKEVLHKTLQEEG